MLLLTASPWLGIRELPVTDTQFEKAAPQRGLAARRAVRTWAIGAVAAMSAMAMCAGLNPAEAQRARVVAVAAKPVPAAAEASATGAVPSTEAAPEAPAQKPKLAGRFFVDFRARTAASYGHAFIWYGRLNEHGKVGKIEVAGLHPATDSVIPYILGHIIPVPAETGKSYGDLDEQYLTASYRVYLSEPDAKRVFAYIQAKQARSIVWQAGIYNCTAFLADVAEFMGLRAPPGSTWMYPEKMVNALRKINGGRTQVVLARAGSSYQ